MYIHENIYVHMYICICTCTIRCSETCSLKSSRCSRVQQFVCFITVWTYLTQYIGITQNHERGTPFLTIRNLDYDIIYIYIWRIIKKCTSQNKVSTNQFFSNCSYCKFYISIGWLVVTGTWLLFSHTLGIMIQSDYPPVIKTWQCEMDHW